MWKEWIFPYNAFNAMKILVWEDRLRKAVSWLEGSKNLPPPVMVTIDPTNLCNTNCVWCKNREFRKDNSTSIPDALFLSLPENIASWGVKSVLLSGGEPLMHPKITEFINAIGKAKLKIGIKTSGVALSKAPLRKAVLSHCSWIGFSVDAASANMYLRVKKAGVGAFDKVIENIEWIVKNRASKSSPRVGMKFLIHHLNYGEMFAFADLAKRMGVDEVHFRPLYLPRYRFTRGVRKTAEYYLRESRKNFELDDFHIYGIVQKFEREWEKVVRFKKCFVAPLSGVFAADSVFYLCADRRGDIELNLGTFTNFDSFKAKWGSDAHREKVARITPQLCPKCGMCIYNEIVERCILEDNMLLAFI